MATLYEISAVKTYPTREKAINAFEKLFGNTNVRYFIHQDASGRFFPVAIGQDAISEGIHFHFNVVG